MNAGYSIKGAFDAAKRVMVYPQPGYEKAAGSVPGGLFFLRSLDQAASALARYSSTFSR